MTAVTPFSLDATRKVDAWRSNSVWPLAYEELRTIQLGVLRHTIDTIGALEAGELRSLGLLSAQHAMALVRQVGFRALHRDRARGRGIEFVGLSDSAKSRANSARSTVTVKQARLRAVWRIASWTPLNTRLIQSVLAPNVTAISHNSLLRETAAKSPRAVGFRHAEAIVAEAVQKGEPDRARAGLVVERYLELLTNYDSDVLPEQLASLRETVESLVLRCERVLQGLKQLKLPTEIWCATGGNLDVRAVAIEVRRRGGSVHVFDHGGANSFVNETEVAYMSDMSVCDTMIMPTLAAVNLAGSAAPPYTAGLPYARLTNSSGDPIFRSASRLASRPRRTARPRVVYAPTCFNGGLQNLPPLLPDPLYLDIQLQIAEAFKDGPEDFWIKPHPEDKLGGQPHPLEGIVRLDRRSFQEVLAEADVLIFDYAQSTAYWEACVTDRPVILLDVGLTEFHQRAFDVVSRRSPILVCDVDDRNFIKVPAAALRDLVHEAGHGDPTEMRALLAGAEDPGS